MATSKVSRAMALFDKDEVKLGKRLGEGGYAYVHEVDSFRVNAKLQKSRHEAARKFLAEHARREDAKGDARYAIKFLKDTLDEDVFEMATIDLKAEAKILSAVEHPNIIKVRGWATERSHDSNFIILDRLYDTLDDRMDKWQGELRGLKEQKIKEKGPLSRLSRRRKANIANVEKQLGLLLAKRLKVAFDIASALEHLHSRRLVYRDLKPSNIGFDIRDDTKLFDLGLSRELPDSKRQYGSKKSNHLTEVFEMSGGVGTRRYMAPEVVRCEPYNETSDVYSFGLMLWELVALKKPFAALSRDVHQARVVEKGERPKLDPSWPKGIQDVMTRAWDADLRKRPSMKEVGEVLRDEIAALRDGDTTGLVEDQPRPGGLLRRRSTHVFDLSYLDDSDRQRRSSRILQKNASFREMMKRDSSERNPLEFLRQSSRVLFADSSPEVLDLDSDPKQPPVLLRRRSSRKFATIVDSKELDEELADTRRRSVLLDRIPSLARIHEGALVEEQ